MRYNLQGISYVAIITWYLVSGCFLVSSSLFLIEDLNCGLSQFPRQLGEFQIWLSLLNQNVPYFESKGKTMVNVS